MKRKIIHVDMDAFFASVEIMDNPKLKGKPIIVGGIKERGVVTTCSYEARRYGIHSAMAGFEARALCPHGVFLPVRISRYREVSNEIFEILYEITDQVEVASIDEAYLDITNLSESALSVGKRIKFLVKKKFGLIISVGISYNKFLAKLASGWDKPDGLKEIKEGEVRTLLESLKLNKIFGLGKQSIKKLNNIGIYKVKDLYALDKEFFIDYFGKNGSNIYHRIRGIDNREVVITRERKSIGKEITLKLDTRDKCILKFHLKKFSNDIYNNLKKQKVEGRTLTLKIKNKDFKSSTRSKTFNHYLNNEKEIYIEGCKILDSIEDLEDLRLIGLTLSNLRYMKKVADVVIEQISLF